MSKTIIVRALVGEGPDATPMTFKGREAWALSELVKAGPSGCTPITRPAPRWSAYVHDLRKAGLVIETFHEPHGGPFPGHHGRYVLRSPVALTEDTAHG